MRLEINVKFETNGCTDMRRDGLVKLVFYTLIEWGENSMCTLFKGIRLLHFYCGIFTFNFYEKLNRK